MRLVFALALLACSRAPQAPWLTEPTASQHAARYFPLAGPHAVDCNSCHGAFDSFKGYDCLGCHTDPPTSGKHAAVAGFVYANASCLACHASGDVSVDHKPFFPIASGDKHAGISCSQCHVDPANRKTIDCTACHAQAATPHATVAVSPIWLQPATASRCLACHADAQVNPVASHAFRISSGSHFQACWSCHLGTRTDKPWGVDFTTETCTTSCHTQPQTDPHHSGVRNYSYSTQACLGCHATGRGG